MARWMAKIMCYLEAHVWDIRWVVDFHGQGHWESYCRYCGKVG